MRATIVASVVVAAALTPNSPAVAASQTTFRLGTVAGHHGCVTTMPRVIRAHVECSDGWQRRLTPCRSEDSRGCYWNARYRGNGVGSSFVDVAGRAYYVKGIVR